APLARPASLNTRGGGRERRVRRVTMGGRRRGGWVRSRGQAVECRDDDDGRKEQGSEEGRGTERGRKEGGREPALLSAKRYVTERGVFERNNAARDAERLAIVTASSVGQGRR